VIIYSQLLESLLKQNKPSISEVFDISAFIKLGVDGFKLGLETTNHNICEKAIHTLTLLLADLHMYMPTYNVPPMKRFKLINSEYIL
jgi:pyruvate kinase